MKKGTKVVLGIGALCLIAPSSVWAETLPAAEQSTEVQIVTESAAFDEPNTLSAALVQQVINGKKYLVYPDGSHYTGWYKMTDSWVLYFNPNDNGAAATGAVNVNGKYYLFNRDGLLCLGGGTPEINGKKYWTNPDGSLNAGWLNLGNWRMYFDDSTYTAKIGLSEIKGKRYMFDNNGVMQGYAGTPVINGQKYWVSEDGSLKTGWLNLGNWRMYFDETTCTAKTGLSEIKGKRYMFDSNGVMQGYAGTPIINGKKYWVSEDGSLKTGWLRLGSWTMYFDTTTCAAATGVTRIDGKLYAFDANGIWISGTGTQVINGKKYYFNRDGSIEVGWIKLGDWTMYFDPDTGAAATGIVTVDGKRRLFDSNGILLTGQGTVVIGGKKYCFAADGSVMTGWISFGGWTFYFDPVTGAAATGIVEIDGKTYYFNSDGVRTTGIQYMNGRTYYFNSDGSLARNTWMIVNGEKIYVDENGIGLTDLSATYPGPYKLVVDRTNCVVTAYAKDSSGNYTIPVRSMVCSVGLPGKETPVGTYYTLAKYPLKELIGPSWGKWATRVVGGVLFHSVATSNPDDPTHSVPAGEYNKLGGPASSGCIRLCVRDAKWIYDHCGLGTEVQIGDNFSMPFGKPTLPHISGSVDPTDMDA